MGSPRVTVLLPAFNAERFVSQAVRSILDQTFTDFELIVLDDGSRDSTGEIVGAFDDPRMRVVREERNRGLVATLNRGLDLAQGELVARQDADDRSLDRRLARQVAALDRDPELVLLGSACRVVDVQGRERRRHTPPVLDTEIRWHMLFHNAFAHSSVMFRRTTRDGFRPRYDPRHLHAEDYDLWARLLRHGRAANLPNVLVELTAHSGQVSQQAAEAQREAAMRISRRELDRMDMALPDEELATLRDHVLHHRALLDELQMRHLARVPALLSRFLEMPPHDPALERPILRRWIAHTVGHIRALQAGSIIRSGLASALWHADRFFVLRALTAEAGCRVGRRLRQAVPPRGAGAE